MNRYIEKSQLTELLEYNTLLQKERSLEAKQEIKRAILREGNIIQLIKIIKDIDARFENPDHHPLSTSNPESAQKHKMSNKKKETQPRPSFFKFYFGTRRELIHLCKKSGLIKFSFFGLKYRLSPEALTLMEEIRTKIQGHALPILKFMLEESWKNLDPEIYNYLFYLNNFFQNYLARFELLGKHPQKNMIFFQNIIKDYLVLLKEQKSISSLLENKLYLALPKDKHKLPDFFELLENLTHRGKIFSLYNLLRLYFSLSFREKLSFESLTKKIILPDIPKDHYLADYHIKSKMKNYLKSLRRNQELQEQSLFFLKFILDENPYLIEGFIQKHKDPMFKLAYIQDDIIMTIFIFLSTFIPFAKPLLTEKITLFKENETLHTNIFVLLFDSWIANLTDIQNKILHTKESSRYISITLDTMEKFRINNQRLASEKEENLCQLAILTQDYLYDFFQKVGELLYNDYRLTNSMDKELVIHKLDTRKFPISSLDIERFVPFFDYGIVGYEDKTVLDMLSTLVLLAGTFLYTLEYPLIKEKLQSKPTLIEKNKKEIERIMRFSFYLDGNQSTQQL